MDLNKRNDHEQDSRKIREIEIDIKQDNIIKDIDIVNYGNMDVEYKLSRPSKKSDKVTKSLSSIMSIKRFELNNDQQM